MKTVAIIPAYNEETRVFAAVSDARAHVDAVVVVDDCSLDRTGDEALRAGAHVLRHLVNRGQGAALQTGTDYALSLLQADAIVHFDADGQMKGEEIPSLLEVLRTGNADIVLGSRFLGKESNMPFSRRLTLRASLLFTICMSGIMVTDTHNGFRALSRKAAEEMRITMDRMAHASELLDLIKVKRLTFAERPVTIRYSKETLEKGMSFKQGFTVLKDFFKSKLL